jgi:hypothetical protein
MLTIQSSICNGGLFYSLSNLTESCIGVFRSFLSTSTPHELSSFKASRLLLSRLLIYLHQQYVLENVFEGATAVLDTDLPDLETVDGVQGVFSLINIAELANVLHPDTYQAGVDPVERIFMMHVRKLGRHLLQWLNDHIVIEPASNTGLSISTVRNMPSLSQLYLLHQVDALLTATRSMETSGFEPSIPGLTYSALRVQVIGCIGPCDDLPGDTETFAWDPETYNVTLRQEFLPSNFSMCALMRSRNLLIE